MLMNLHLINIDNFNVDEMLIIWLGLFEINIDKFMLIRQICHFVSISCPTGCLQNILLVHTA